MVTTPTDLDLINTLRLRPGDTIQLRHGSDKTWTERRRTLLWHGEQVAVWSATSRWSWGKPVKWTEPIETATPCRDDNWRKVDA
jgi:hypothetical protein